MMNHLKILFSGFSLLLVMIAGCTKESGVCVSGSGELIRQERSVSAFDSISLSNYVNLFLSCDTITRVTVEAGSKIQPGISVKVVDRQLIITNYNTCNWLRSYKSPINVYVSSPKLWKIYYEASGNITSTNTLKYDSLKIEVWGGCGTISLNLDISRGFFALNSGTADFILRGKCPINSIYSSQYGKIDARDLQTAYTFITNNGSNDCYVRASQDLQCTIGNIGDVYYTGNPVSVKEVNTGSGKLIPF
jgi:hypothetical protein